MVKNGAWNDPKSLGRRRNMHHTKGADAGCADISGDSKQLKDELATLLNTRYNPELKLLDLSNLREWKSGSAATASIFEKSFSKAFGVLMIICEEAFKSDEERRETVQSIRLANNDLVNLRYVTDLPSTFPDLKNLDLSGNKLKDLGSICIWRPRLRQLEHILVTGNPLEHITNYEAALFKRIPSLKLVNTTPKPERQTKQKSTDPVSNTRINNSHTPTATAQQPGHVNTTTLSQLPSQAGTHSRPSDTIDTTTFSQLLSQADTHSHPSGTHGWYAPENICIPEGWGLEGAGKTDEQVKMEQAAYHLTTETHMTLEYSGTCLAENGWDLGQAYHKFTLVKDSIPPEGWMRVEKGGRFVGSKEVEAILMAQGYLS